MSSVCILTDITAQFPQPTFPGQAFICILPTRLEWGDQVIHDPKNLKLASFPPSARGGALPRLIIPEQQTLQEYFLRLSREFDHILAIFASNELCSLIQDSSRALEAMEHRLNLQIIDSHTTSIGLGYLVQTASNLIAGGATAADAERWIRNLIPHQYTLLCTSGLSYLHASGYLDHAQATAGEILNFLPIFTLEEGRLTPVEKVRNFRQVMDYYQEFLEEFDHFQYIAFVQGHPTLNTESRLLRQFVQENFPKTPFTEHTLSSAAATLIGPKSISLFITEKF